MHLLFAQFTMRWMALVTGAAHTTSVLRAMAHNAPSRPTTWSPSTSCPTRSRRCPLSGSPLPHGPSWFDTVQPGHRLIVETSASD